MSWKLSTNGYDTVATFDTYEEATSARAAGQRVAFVPDAGWRWDGESDSETLERETPHGVFRAKIQRDSEPWEPENDGGCPIVRLDYSRSWGTVDAEMTGYGSDSAAHDGLPEDAARIIERFSEDGRRGLHESVDLFERYLRIFHGGDIAHRTPDNYSDSHYVAYTTKAMRDYWNGDTTGETAELGEYESWLEGDVYGVSVERATEFDEDGTPISWEETEDGTVWGHFGETWAKQAAEDELAAEIESAAGAMLPLETREAGK